MYKLELTFKLFKDNPELVLTQGCFTPRDTSLL